MTKPGSICCKLPFKAPVEDAEARQEVAVSLAAAKETSVDDAVVAG